MTTLTRAWREAYDPDIGNNRAFPEKDRLFLEIASGLSAAQLKQMSDSITAADQARSPRKAWAAAFAPFVRLVGAHHRWPAGADARGVHRGGRTWLGSTTCASSTRP